MSTRMSTQCQSSAITAKSAEYKYYATYQHMQDSNVVAAFSRGFASTPMIDH